MKITLPAVTREGGNDSGHEKQPDEKSPETQGLRALPPLDRTRAGGPDDLQAVGMHQQVAMQLEHHTNLETIAPGVGHHTAA